MTYYNIHNTAERIRNLRMQRGLTQQAAADQLGISFGFLSRMERGLQSCSPEILAKLSIFYGVSIDYLVLGAKDAGIPRAGIERLVCYLQGLLDGSKVHNFAAN